MVDIDHPTRSLELLFLIPRRCVLVLRALGNSYSSPEDTPSLYACVCALFQQLTTLSPERDVQSLTPASGVETLCAADITSLASVQTFLGCPASALTFPDSRRTSISGLSSSYKGAAAALGDSVQRPFSKLRTGRNRHSRSCTVSCRASFLVFSVAAFCCVFSWYHSRGTLPRSVFAHLLLLLGELVLGRNRCCAVRQGRRIHHAFQFISDSTRRLLNAWSTFSVD